MSSWNTFVKNSSFSRIFQIAALKMSSDNSFSKLLSSMLSLIPEPLNNPVYIKIYFVKCPHITTTTVITTTTTTTTDAATTTSFVAM